MNPIRTLSACITALKEMYQSQYSYRASSLAFSTLLSLVPMVAVFVFIMSKAPIFSDMSILAKNYVLANFVPISRHSILLYLNKFTHQASQLPIFSILFLFVTSTLLVISIDDSLNIIWHKKRRVKDFLHLFIYPLSVLLIPIFIFMSALSSSFLFFLFSYLPAIKIMAFIITLAINTMMLTLLYAISANINLSWHNFLSGGLIAALLLEFSKIGFAIYINQFSNYDAIYGTLATIPILLIWLYIFWLLILYGACIAKARAKKR